MQSQQQKHLLSTQNYNQHLLRNKTFDTFYDFFYPWSDPGDSSFREEVYQGEEWEGMDSFELGVR